MGVLLANPPTLAALEARGLGGQMSYFEYERSFTDQYWYKSYPGEHLGLMALVAVLRAADVPVRSVNGQTECHRFLDQTWAAMRAAGDTIDVSLVGLSGPCQVFEENLELARRARRQWPDALIVLGNQFATLNYRRILADYPEFDVVTLGEGETTIVALAGVTATADLERIEGIAYRDANGTTQVRPPKVEPLDLDTLPEIARDELPKILEIGVSATVYTTRGCPYRCNYCTTGQTAGQLHKKLAYRERSVGPVVDEIERLVRDYQIPHITIVDDLFVAKTPHSLARAVEFAHTMIERDVRIPFMLDCRLDSADPDVFRELRRAGLYRVFVGIETGSGDQLTFYNKRYGVPYDVEFVRSRVGGLQELGIEVIPGILTYHPASTPEELRESLRVIDACGYVSTWQFLCEIFAHPGTTLWHQYRRAGWLAQEWPVPSWEFQDSRVRLIRDSVIEAIENGGGHTEARNAFADAIGLVSDSEVRL
ncbi:B12-binding domain-containing radical SAM protein [Plantactinospora soyae]|uniref:Radical SAM superfamily enzyme YgiQ (UPF0313 family) n=1 Tax=Plantactinospora soyae TaxID=1544732 RepID=A0A927ME97_9ACTN|nr:radical SAM protein [Plantactinospora soyae]MBE1489505.1 radical SAM superfamily enzyme YgiQ (UPF0313 family) [Plantactinospora soyae]